jgi:selenocysteine lyase/cysteine desulfurase
MSKLQGFKDEFSSRNGIHFNNAGLSPVNQKSADRAAALIRTLQVEASFEDASLIAGLRETRETLGAFLGADPSCVAFTPNCATALSTAALGFPLVPSDTVLTVDQEYSSNFYPWKIACERTGARLKVHTSNPDRTLDLSRLLADITPDVRIVALSWVQFQTGSVVDLEVVGQHCHAMGAFLVVDGIQGLGQLPFNLNQLPVDFIAGGSHKWLCSITGQGFFAAKPDFMKHLRPNAVGGGTFNRFGTFADPDALMETSARRFEPGGFGFTQLFSLDAALKVLMAVGMNAIESEISRLSRQLRSGFLNLGLDLVTPFDQKSGITSLRLSSDQELLFLRDCQAAKVAVAKRGEFIRFSPHAFCSDHEVERVLELVKGVLK